MIKARDITDPVIAFRISMAESLGANREAILKDANITSYTLADTKARVTVEQTIYLESNC